MATFEARVEAITGLDIDGSSVPSQDDVTEFLKEHSASNKPHCNYNYCHKRLRSSRPNTVLLEQIKIIPEVFGCNIL